MICKRHNRVVRIGKCPMCVQDEIESNKLDYEIKKLEREIKEPIVIW